VRALVEHLVAGNLWVRELAAGKTIDEVGDTLDRDLLGDDAKAAFRESMEAAVSALDAPGALSQVFHLSFGDVPGSVFAGQRFLDVLVHAWDVATATGQDTGLDPELVSRCYEMAAARRAGLRAGGLFADEVAVPPDADPQTRLLGLLGRRA
jgi:uncharacterized protein (TIGR03086 family)